MEIDIEYCVPCGLRDEAIAVQTELLSTYGRDLDSVSRTAAVR
ncbi:MAG: Rdx family protein [Haloarcula sp.]